jgi:hypothetical protein
MREMKKYSTVTDEVDGKAWRGSYWKTQEVDGKY